MKTIKVKGYQDYNLAGYLWDNVDNPVGVVQIIHGMQEHAKRYDHFAKYLNTQGLIVFASDLRGHGQTAIENNAPFGYSDGDIFSEILQDQIVITDMLKDKYKLPISIFAHSFGSFIGQRYMVENGFKIKNIVLCGSTYTNSMTYKFGRFMSKLACAFGGKKKPAKLIEKFSLNKYGKRFQNGNWLSRDEENWYKYTHDPLCGMPFPNSFYRSLFSNATHNYQKLKNIPYYLPILVISGTDDPVAEKNGSVKLFFTYGKANKRVYFKTYMNARHELLNETNNKDIYKDLSEFFIRGKMEYLAIAVR